MSPPDLFHQHPVADISGAKYSPPFYANESVSDVKPPKHLSPTTSLPPAPAHALQQAVAVAPPAPPPQSLDYERPAKLSPQSLSSAQQQQQHTLGSAGATLPTDLSRFVAQTRMPAGDNNDNDAPAAFMTSTAPPSVYSSTHSTAAAVSQFSDVSTAYGRDGLALDSMAHSPDQLVPGPAQYTSGKKMPFNDDEQQYANQHVSPFDTDQYVYAPSQQGVQQQQSNTSCVKPEYDVTQSGIAGNLVVNQSAQTTAGSGYRMEFGQSQQQQQQQQPNVAAESTTVTSSRGPSKRSYAADSTHAYRSPNAGSTSSDNASSVDGSLSPYASSTGDGGNEQDHGLSKSTSSADISRGGLLATTYKVINDSKILQTNLSELPPPVPKPLFTDAFDDPVLFHHDIPSFRSVANDLRHACLLAYDKLPAKVCPSDPSYVQMFNFGEDTIRQLVVLAKNLPPFQALCRDDQICLLKASVLHMMVLKSAMSYDPEKRGWRVQDSRGERDVVPNAVRGSQDGRVLMNHYGIIVIAILVASGRDLIVIILLIVLSLLSDGNLKDPSELQDRDKVQDAFKVYHQFLHSYVMLKYPEKDDMFEDLLKSLDIVRDFSDTYINAMLKSPLSQLNPLLLEINDIMSS